MDVATHVPLVGYERGSRVQPDPQPNRPVRELPRDRSRGLEGARRRREGDEERVALRVHLDPALRRARLSHDPPMLREHLRIPLRAQIVQELGRALHVREEEGDGAGRKAGPHWPE